MCRYNARGREYDAHSVHPGTWPQPLHTHPYCILNEVKLLKAFPVKRDHTISFADLMALSDQLSCLHTSKTQWPVCTVHVLNKLILSACTHKHCHMTTFEHCTCVRLTRSVCTTSVTTLTHRHICKMLTIIHTHVHNTHTQCKYSCTHVCDRCTYTVHARPAHTASRVQDWYPPPPPKKKQLT